MKSWAFLRSNEVSKHLGDDKPPIYQAVLTAVDRIGVDFDLLSDQCQDLLFKANPPLPSGCLALSGGNGGSTAPLTGIISGVIFMVVLVRTGKATSRGGSLMA